MARLYRAPSSTVKHNLRLTWWQTGSQQDAVCTWNILAMTTYLSRLTDSRNSPSRNSIDCMYQVVGNLVELQSLSDRGLIKDVVRLCVEPAKVSIEKCICLDTG